MVIFVWLPKDVRMQRLKERETSRYGSDIAFGGKRYESHQNFMEWASKYDDAGAEMRSKVLHEGWLATLPCEVVRLEGNISVEEKLRKLDKIIHT